MNAITTPRTVSAGPLKLVGLTMFILAVATLNGCTLLQTQPPARVVEPQIELPDRRPIDPPLGALRVLRPSADQTRDSRRVLVRRNDSTLQVLPQHLWLDSTPDMLRGLMLRSLEHSDAFVDVHAGGPAKWLLASEIRRFEAVDLDTGSVTAEIELQLRLLQQNSGEIVSRHLVFAQTRASGNDTADIVRAFEQALTEALVGLNDWAVEAVRAQTEKLNTESTSAEPEQG